MDKISRAALSTHFSVEGLKLYLRQSKSFCNQVRRETRRAIGVPPTVSHCGEQFLVSTILLLVCTSAFTLPIEMLRSKYCTVVEKMVQVVREAEGGYD